MKNRSGVFKSQLSGKKQYQTFVPKPLQDVTFEMDRETIDLLLQAYRTLGALDATTSWAPNIELFIRMCLYKEALLSSQIDGVEAKIEDIFDPVIRGKGNAAAAEVHRYIQAVDFALKQMKDLPLGNSLLLETHKQLMDGEQAADGSSGAFRSTQNWIGSAGSTLYTASYIPPAPSDMMTALNDLEKYLHTKDGVSDLIKIALVHYQFETIHPFLDGNGRMGRIMISLFLAEKKLLTIPILCLSSFLKRNRTEYYDCLSEVRNKGNYEQWLQFFFRGVGEAAQETIETIEQLTALRKKNREKIAQLPSRKETIQTVLNHLEKNPIIELGKTAKELNLSYNTVAKAVEILITLGVLVQSGGEKRNRIFSYEDYLSILRKDTE